MYVSSAVVWRGIVFAYRQPQEAGSRCSPKYKRALRFQHRKSQSGHVNGFGRIQTLHTSFNVVKGHRGVSGERQVSMGAIRIVETWQVSGELTL
jgi:hypothetical protein